MADRQDSDREVLTSLPRARPVRRSAKRGARPAAEAAASPPTASAAAAARKPPRAAPQPKQQPATDRAAPPPPRRTVPPAGYAAPATDGDERRAGSADVVATAVQAAGELAQIGFAVGRQALRSLLDRVPRP